MGRIHGFTWFSVMDHLIQIGNVGAPDEPFMEGWTILSALLLSPAGSASPHSPRRSAIAILRFWPRSPPESI